VSNTDASERPGIDPDRGGIVPLFSPRRDTWAEHLRRAGALIVGLTPTARATIYVLAMNEPDWVELLADFEAQSGGGQGAERLSPVLQRRPPRTARELYHRRKHLNPGMFPSLWYPGN
jgi:hypothetical protein